MFTKDFFELFARTTPTTEVVDVLNDKFPDDKIPNDKIPATAFFSVLLLLNLEDRPDA